MCVRYLFVITKDKVSQSKVGIGKLVSWKRLVKLHLEVSVNWFCKLYQRQRLSREHVRFSNSDSIVLGVLLHAFDQILILQSVILFKQGHEISKDLDKDGLLLLQNVNTWVLA